MDQDTLSSLVVPPRKSLRTKEKRKKSLPATTTASATTKHSANLINVQPASTEVISSLISTLSAISSPARHHFDSSPTTAASKSTPPSPRPWRAAFRFPLVSHHGYVYKRGPSSPTRAPFGVDENMSQRRLSEAQISHPELVKFPVDEDDRGWETLLQGTRDIQAESRTEFGVRRKDRPSIKNVKTEPSIRDSTTSSDSITTHSRLRVMGSYKELRFSCSNDGIQDGSERLWIHDRSQADQKTVGSQPGLPFLDLCKNSDSLGSPPNIRIPKRRSSARHSVATMELDNRSLDGAASPTSVGNGNVVPSREPLKRYSSSASSAPNRRRPHRSEQEPQPRDKNISFDSRPDIPERELAQVMDDLVGADEVTRRIRELQDQKRLRAQEQNLSTPDLSACLKSPTLSPQPRSQPSAMPQTDGELTMESPLDTAETDTSIEHPSAPSPAIPQRVDRTTSFRIASTGTPVANPFLVKEQMGLQKRQNSPPRRSNSRLLRRLSRPISSDLVEKHRRTLSGGLSLPQTPIDERPINHDLVDEAVDDFLTAPRLSQRVQDPQTGRMVSFSEVGDPAGSAVFCCVGMGLTRYITAFYDELALTLKLRLITPDRPGVGASEAHLDGSDTPLGWPDDVHTICQHLNLTKFSILAHSAGAIYALATALRMPQHIRGRIHLLAPWIPPSQLLAIGSQQEALPASALPYSQRFLRSLPATFLKAANSSWLSATSASVTSKTPRRSKNKNRDPGTSDDSKFSRGASPSPSIASETDVSSKAASPSKDKDNLGLVRSDLRPSLSKRTSSRITEKDRYLSYESRLTEAIWDRATKGANPAVDLFVCLERRQPIGFRYEDVKKSVVVHHGSKDTRVPVENVKWLGKTMKKCEVRILEGEGHGLMASAAVMGNILMEISQEWEDWIRVTRGRGGLERRVTAAT